MAYNKNKPASSTSLRDSNPQILANWDALEIALNREHEFSTGGTVADQAHHKKGSARCYFQDAEPTTRRDGTSFTSEDLGSLWFDTNSSPDNLFYVLTATTPTWTLISTSLIAEMVAAAHSWAAAQTFDVAAILSKAPTLTEGIVANNSFLQARNAADNGNVDLIKADGSDVPVVPDGTETATNTAPSSDKDLVNKKYADDRSVDGTPTGVFTKYLTGTLSAGGDVTVAHGVTAANILRVTFIGFQTTDNFYQAQASYRAENSTIFVVVNYDADNIIMTGGTSFANQAYRIGIDYTL